MKHWFIDEWKVNNKVGYVDCKKLFDYIKIYKITPELISFSQISYKKLVDLDRELPRYKLANTKYPMIVSQLPNPNGLPYRLIDGRHRLDKLLLNGINSAFFYVIPVKTVLNFTVWYKD
jgi:hypothetical protein